MHILSELRALSRQADLAAYWERIHPTQGPWARPCFVVVAHRALVGVFENEDSAIAAALDVTGEPLGALCVFYVDGEQELGKEQEQEQELGQEPLGAGT